MLIACDGEPINVAAQKIGRSVEATKTKRKELRRQRRLDRQKPSWKDDEPRLAALFAAGKTDPEIAHILGRSAAGVQIHRSLTGLLREAPLFHRMIAVRMVISPWTTLPDGVLSRTIRAR
jgi:hypothetical protein